MIQKFNQTTMFSGGIKAPSKSDGGIMWGKPIDPGVDGVTITSDDLRPIRRTVVNVVDLVLDFANATDSGTVKVMDLPNTNILIMGSAVNLVGTKGGTTNGLETNTDINLALGTTATADATLSSTDANLIASTAITANNIDATWQAGGSVNVAVAAGASNGIHINLGTGNLSADDTITFNGTVTLFWVDLGTYAGG